jgi:ABC-type glycerol-3-phosphate transport system permease component
MRYFLSHSFRSRALPWLIISVFMVWTLVPLVWNFLSTFKEPLEIYEARLFPESFRLSNYLAVFQIDGFFRYFANSVFLAIGSTLFAVAVSCLAAYGFARYAFPLRHILLVFVLIPRIIPRAALVVPLYQLYNNLGLLNTYTVLLISYTATAVPLSTWILVGFFKGVPISLEESARLDGAGFLTILFRVVLPVAMPGLVTVMIVSGVQAWNEFPFVLSFVNDRALRTLPYGLYVLQDSLGIQDWPVINSFNMLTILPIIFAYLLFQRKVINSLVSGAVK